MSAPGRRRLTFYLHLCGYLCLSTVVAAGGYAAAAGKWFETHAVPALSGSWWQITAPAAAALAMLWGLVWWLVLRRTIPDGAKPKTADPGIPRSDADAEKQRRARLQQYREHRLYLHLVTLMQREGRLLDFLNEDLEGFADEQIGAAARNVHSGCRKTIQNCLAPAGVLTDLQEGDRTAVEAGFDANAIKMVGNVTGEPPFSGIVRHRGWRVTEVELPEFTGSRSADILAPAEVEIS
jgi:hypothetical protein